MNIGKCFYNPVVGLEASPVDFVFSNCMLIIYGFILGWILVIIISERRKEKNGTKTN